MSNCFGRVKQLREGPYTHKDAMAAGGLIIDNGRRNTDVGMKDVDMAA